MRGVFELKTPYDLLQKLQHDLRALKRKPASTYRAFNFFVTAEHMKDWLYLGHANDGVRRTLENETPLLQVCSHLANGAKHFIVEAKHHKSVTGTGHTGAYRATGYWPAGLFHRGYWARKNLVVELQGSAAQLVGSTISAVELADRVFAFWDSRPDISRP